MSWRLLAGGATTASCELGFSVASRGGEKKALRFTICAQLMQKTGWSEESKLQLMIDKEAGLGALQAVEKDGRKVSVTSVSGRAACFFLYDADVAKFFEEYDRIVELDGVDIDETGAVTFTLPPVDAGEEQTEEGAQS